MEIDTSGNPLHSDHEIALYAAHITEKIKRFQEILDNSAWDSLVISSGEERMQFQDDIAYPFKANPYFREWIPLNQRHNAYLQIIKGEPTPVLYLLTVEDIWHTPPQTLPNGFEKNFTVIEYTDLVKIKNELTHDQSNCAFIGETNPLELSNTQTNPPELLTAIDFQRRYKTPYEHHCVRTANRLAAPAHSAAQQVFMTGGSEFDISHAYLKACNRRENEMPYPIIVGINENAAILHHKHLNNRRPSDPRSFLIDAGVDYNGYASDISRTYAFDPKSEFADMISLMDQKQRELVAAGVIGKTAIDMHLLMYQKIAEVLIHFGVLKCSAESAIAANIIRPFCPHSLGHHLGCNVHDKGARLANANGDQLPKLDGHKGFKNAADIVPTQMHTIEPGLYFIPGLLNKLREGEHRAAFDWGRIDRFIPYGGIRIEDNIAVHSDGRLENFTRGKLQ